MNLEQISKIKDPCIFIDEYQKLINDFEYFMQNPTNTTSSNRVADVLFSYSQFFVMTLIVKKLGRIFQIIYSHSLRSLQKRIVKNV